MIFVSDRKENIVGKRENAGYQHFLTMFSKAVFCSAVKPGIVWERVNFKVFQRSLLKWFSKD